MPYKASLVTSKFYSQNRIFRIEDPILNRDNILYVPWYLKSILAKKGIELATADIHKPKESDIIIYFDIPKKLPNANEINKSFLILQEVAAVMPKNWDIKKHNYFTKVFTFCDDFIDNKKYFKLNSCRPFNKKVPINILKKNKFCAMISGNKISKHPLELYTKRLEAVSWFARNHPNDFDFYGLGWDQKIFSGLLRPFNRVHLARKFFAKKYKTWKGPVKNKFDVLKNYKFAVAFENAKSINGYITGDKIFDPLEAGCIPIYQGAPNITKYVPKNCFIDWEDFGNWEGTFKYMKNLSENEHIDYLDNIKYFIENIAINGEFSEYGYVNSLVPEIEKLVFNNN